MNSRHLAIALATVSALSCQPRPRRAAEPRIKAADINAWTGAPLIDLETQPHLVAVSPEKRDLSDGSQLWVYAECIDKATERRCAGSAMRLGSSTYASSECTGGEIKKSCCVSQFRVRGNVVESLQLEGDICVTHCNYRPASRPCETTVAH